MKEIWPEWTITTNHPASKDGIPVLVSPAGKVYRPEDVDPEPDRFNQTDLAKALGVSTAAIRDRMRRGTVPEYDGLTTSGRGYWMAGTIRAILSKDRS